MSNHYSTVIACYFLDIYNSNLALKSYRYLLDVPINHGIHAGRVKVGWEASQPQRKSNTLVHTLHDKTVKESLHTASQGLQRLLWMVDHPYNRRQVVRNSEAYADPLIEVNIDLFQSKLEKTKNKQGCINENYFKKNEFWYINWSSSSRDYNYFVDEDTKLFNDDKETPPSQDANFKKTLEPYYIRSNVMTISNVIFPKTAQNILCFHFSFSICIDN